MEDKLISFETAKLAKEKGFNEICYNAFGGKQETLIEIGYKNSDEIFIMCPTQSLLQRWLREKHKIYVYCIPKEFEKGNGRKIVRWANNFGIVKNKFSSTYEKALEVGLFEALKLIE